MLYSVYPFKGTLPHTSQTVAHKGSANSNKEKQELYAQAPVTHKFHESGFTLFLQVLQHSIKFTDS
jgi:hypothetical protein